MTDALSTQAVLVSVFFSAFVSSTVLPGASEAVLIAGAKAGHALMPLWLVASLGNTLGGVSSWWLGRWIAHYRPARFGHDPRRARALAWLQRWGWPGLLLSWLPIIGDPLCVAAGWLRLNIYWSVFAIALGKTARYAVLLLVLA